MSKREPITYADSVPDLPGDNFSRRLRELRVARLFAAANDDRPSEEHMKAQAREQMQDERAAHVRPRTMIEEDHPRPVPRPSPNFAAEVDAEAFNTRWEAERLRAAPRSNPNHPNLKGDFMSDQDRNPPEETLRDGNLKAAIWRNESAEHGAYHSVTLARTYKDQDGNMRDTSSFRAKDMLGLSELTRRAHHKTMERDRAAFKEHRMAQSQEGPKQTKGHTK
ncbi:hypothetical protein [Gymnodinialimonas sp.]